MWLFLPRYCYMKRSVSGRYSLFSGSFYTVLVGIARMVSCIAFGAERLVCRVILGLFR